MNIDPNQANQIQAQILASRQNANASHNGPAAKAQASSKAAPVEFNILDKLRNQPEIRPEVVAKGKELLKDPNFPSPEMINSIAKLITPLADDE